MLEVANISVAAGEIPILRGISVKLERGEMVAIAGPNGAGKTTLLRSISGLLPVLSGSITFAGEIISQGRAPHQLARLGISHVPEGRGIFAELSVRENLCLGQNALPKNASRPDFDLVFELFPILKRRLEQQAGMLSGGEQQMLAIGRGLISHPRLLLVDELSLGLAPIIATELLGVLRRLADEGLTVLLVEQNIHQILRVTDRAFVLVNGSIAFEGPTASLAEHGEILELYFGGGKH